MESDIDAAARFEVNRFMYACAGTIAGPTLTDSQQHTLFHQFKKVLEDAEYKINRARTPPTGHIIDDAGVVRKVLGTLPVTADGCVVGVGAQVWFIAYGGTEILWAIIHDSRKGWLQSPVCYSTAKAAEAAKEGKA